MKSIDHIDGNPRNNENLRFRSSSFPRGVAGEMCGKSETSARIDRLRLDSPANIAASLDALKALFTTGAIEIIMSKRGVGILEFVAREKVRT